MTACTYCGCDVAAHDPIFVREGEPDGPLAGSYCNYACLTAHVREADLDAGATCNWQPS
jgi:hypothetical protein